MSALIAMAAAAALSMPAPTSSTAPPPDLVSWGWGLDAGLMSGIAVMHAVQPIAAAVGEVPWRDKLWISTAGAVIYGAATVGLALRVRWVLWVAILGPVVGLTAVLGGWALSRAGVVDWTISPDAHQLVGGVLQLGAAALSVWLLKVTW